MATISNTPRPGYVWDSTDNVWYPIGVGAHQHTNAADTPAVMPYSTYAAAGKNKIINGDFAIWQRGTSFTSGYTADRFFMATNQGTHTRQTFAPGTAPVTGYEGQYFLRFTSTISDTDQRIAQPIENVQTFAGQTVTLSFWAKSDTANALSDIYFQQIFGSGGSTTVVYNNTPPTLTTSWARYSITLTLSSIAGKTIGTNSNLRVTFQGRPSTAFNLDVWGIQLEAGSVATAFQTATGNPASELAACQRYYEKSYNTDVAPGTSTFTGGFEIGGSSGSFGDQVITIKFAVAKRGAPTMKAWTRGGVANQFTYAKSGASADVAASFIYAGFTQTVAYAPVGANFIASTLSGHWTAEAEL